MPRALLFGLWTGSYVLTMVVSISAGLPVAFAQDAANPAAPVLFDEDKDGLPGASVGPSRKDIEDLIRSIGRDPVSPELVDRIDSVFRPRWASVRKFEDARTRVADKTFLTNMDMLHNEIHKTPGKADTRALIYRAISVPTSPTIDDLREQYRDDMDRETGTWKTLKGRVLGEEIGGKPIAGAVVSSVSGGLARTDGKGEFAMKTRAPKVPFPLTVTIEAPGRALTQYGFKWDDLEEVTTEVFRIPEAVSFGGKVVDPQGKPIAGADLELWIAQDAVCRDGSLAKLNFATSLTMKARTDAEGRYAFRGVPPELEGRQAASTFNVSHPGFEPRQKQYAPNEWLGPGWDITMEPGCVLTGIVVDEHGKPISGATIRAAYNAPVAIGGFPVQRTDANGAFRFENLPETTMNLSLLSGADLPTNEPATTKRGEVVEIKITVAKGRFVTGKVVDADGKPVADAQVGWLSFVEDGGKPRKGRSPKMAATNEDGRFRVGPVSKGRYLVTAQTRSPKAVGTVEAEAGGEPVVIELKPAPNDQ